MEFGRCSITHGCCLNMSGSCEATRCRMMTRLPWALSRQTLCQVPEGVKAPVGFSAVALHAAARAAAAGAAAGAGADAGTGGARHGRAPPRPPRAAAAVAARRRRRAVESSKTSRIRVTTALLDVGICSSNGSRTQQCWMDMAGLCNGRTCRDGWSLCRRVCLDV